MRRHAFLPRRPFRTNDGFSRASTCREVCCLCRFLHFLLWVSHANGAQESGTNCIAAALKFLRAQANSQHGEETCGSG